MVINELLLWALEMLGAAGFLFDSSMAPMRIVATDYPHSRHAIDAARRRAEFPPLVDRRFGQNSACSDAKPNTAPAA
jgi:hypothetical protein